MKTGVKNMTEGNPLSLLLSFSLPLMLSNTCQQLYLIVVFLFVTIQFYQKREHQPTLSGQLMLLFFRRYFATRPYF